jgi:hypothetical protein
MTISVERKRKLVSDICDTHYLIIRLVMCQSKTPRLSLRIMRGLTRQRLSLTHSSDDT